MSRWIRILLATALLHTLPACVYYNKFYNAKKQFADAHEQREKSEAEPENRIFTNTYRDYYLAAIKKASLVLDLHPDSKWVDDSLILIGKSYYYRGEHKEALEKFDEILENFPDSDLTVETLYWKALAAWGNDDISQSRDLLNRVGNLQDPVYRPQARLALAELEHAQGNYDVAERSYLSLVGDLKDRELETRQWKGLGDTYFAQADYDNALNAYRKTLQSKPDDLTNYQTQLQIGVTQELTYDLDGALATYEKMERIKRFRLYQPKIRIRIANVYRLTGDVDGALEAYDRIIKRNPRTETSAEAYYQIAMIEHEVRRNNEKALELFAQARKERSTSEAALKAREMETTLFELDRFKKRGEKESKRGNEALFNVAEIYLFSLGEVDSALSTYERVLARADSNFTPKALYGIGLIQADSLGNAHEANKIFNQLVEEYPVTPYAVDARRRLGQDRSDNILAEARFIEAETLKSEGASPNDVVDILRQVTDEYPNSIYAPKALYALAWAYENDLDDPDSATTQYERLVDTYPFSEFAELSEDKVKQIKKEARDRVRQKERAEREAKKAEEAEQKASEEARKTAEATSAAPAPDPEPATDAGLTDTSLAAKEAESPAKTTPPDPPPPSKPIPTDGPLEGSQAEQLPSLVYAPPPQAREELLEEEEEMNPNVNVRMLVGKKGKVTRVVIVDGDELLHEAAFDQAFLYRFEPGKHEGKVRDVWIEFPITFIPPAGGGGEPE